MSHPHYIVSVIGKLGLFGLKFKWTIPVSSNEQFAQVLKVVKLYAGQISKTRYWQINRWVVGCGVRGKETELCVIQKECVVCVLVETTEKKT